MRNILVIAMILCICIFVGTLRAQAQSHSDDYYARKINLRVLRALDEYGRYSTLSRTRYYEDFPKLFTGDDVRILNDILPKNRFDQQVGLEEYIELAKKYWLQDDYGLDVEVVIRDVGAIVYDAGGKSEHQHRGTLKLTVDKIITGFGHKDCTPKLYHDTIPIVLTYSFDLENDKYLIEDIQAERPLGRYTLLTVQIRDLFRRMTFQYAPIMLHYPSGNAVQDTVDEHGKLFLGRVGTGAEIQIEALKGELRGNSVALTNTRPKGKLIEVPIEKPKEKSTNNEKTSEKSKENPAEKEGGATHPREKTSEKPKQKSTEKEGAARQPKEKTAEKPKIAVARRFEHCGDFDSLFAVFRLPLAAAELEIGLMDPEQQLVSWSGSQVNPKTSQTRHFSCGIKGGLFLRYGQKGYWLLKTGIGWESYRYTLKMDTFQRQYVATDPFGTPYLRTNLVTNILETQRLGYLSVPLAVEKGFNLPLGLKAYVSAGGRCLFPVVSNREASADALYTGRYGPYFNILIKENGVYNFGKYDLSAKEKLNATRPMVVAELGGGLRKPLYKWLELGLGLRYNHSLNSILSKDAAQPTLSTHSGEFASLGAISNRYRFGYLSYTIGILIKI